MSSRANTNGPSELTQQQHAWAQSNRSTLQSVPRDRLFFANQLDEPQDVRAMWRHNIVEKVDRMQHGSGSRNTSRQVVWRLTKAGVRLQDMHDEPSKDVPILPCSRPDDGVYHTSFTSWGCVEPRRILGDGEAVSLIECKECGAKWTKEEIQQ